MTKKVHLMGALLASAGILVTATPAMAQDGGEGANSLACLINLPILALNADEKCGPAAQGGDEGSSASGNGATAEGGDSYVEWSESEHGSHPAPEPGGNGPGGGHEDVPSGPGGGHGNGGDHGNGDDHGSKPGDDHVKIPVGSVVPAKPSGAELPAAPAPKVTRGHHAVTG